MLFKACPKCHGDLHSGRDMYGTYLQCFQCGMMVDVTAVIAAKKSMEEKDKRQAA